MYMQPSVAGVALVLAAGLVHAQTMAPPWKAFPDQFSAAKKNCYACKDGEAMVQSIVTIPHSNYVDIDSPPCAEPSMQTDQLSFEAKQQLAAAYYRQPPGAGLFATGLGGAQSLNPRGGSASAFGWVTSRARAYQLSSCGRNIVIVPNEADVTRVEPSMKCPAGGWCAQGKTHFEKLDDNLRVYTVVGKNWSHNTPADTVLRVFYRR